jgi:ubiquinone/menaquinone biosynthesis C-methylase UbiE
MKIQPSASVSRLGFGFVPTGSFRQDLVGRLLGAQILFKRLQARDIFAALDLRPSERVLDFGCGGGYLTIEMAKLAREAVGIDINSYLLSIPIPPALQGRLSYLVVEGRSLPFPDGDFDTVLASEVLPMVADPREFLAEIRRVLKPGGRLVVVNGAGHPAIREAYRSDSWLLRRLRRRYGSRVPASYEEYCRILQASFGTAQKRFLEPADVHELLRASAFQVRETRFSPGYLAGAYLSWSQFILYLRTGKTLTQRRFAPNFLALSFLRLFETRNHEGGLICVAQR